MCSPCGVHIQFPRERIVSSPAPCDACALLLRVGVRDDPARLAAITTISTGDGSHSHEHLAMLTTIFTAARHRPSTAPFDALDALRLPCSSRDVLTFRRSPSRSWLRSPHKTSTPCDVSISRVPLGGHVSCSSFDDHAMLAFTVPAFALVFRRSRSHPRSGLDVVRSCERPSSIPLRVHALSLLLAKQTKARSPSRARVRVRLSTLTAGRTPSAHSPRAREIVSRFDGSQLRSSFCSRTVAPCRTRPSRSCSSCDDHVRVAVRALECMFTPCDAPIL